MKEWRRIYIKDSGYIGHLDRKDGVPGTTFSAEPRYSQGEVVLVETEILLISRRGDQINIRWQKETQS